MARSNTYRSEVVRKAWEASGSPSCEHESIAKDSNDWGLDPGGDFYCTACGEIFHMNSPRVRARYGQS